MTTFALVLHWVAVVLQLGGTLAAIRGVVAARRQFAPDEPRFWKWAGRNIAALWQVVLSKLRRRAAKTEGNSAIPLKPPSASASGEVTRRPDAFPEISPDDIPGLIGTIQSRLVWLETMIAAHEDRHARAEQAIAELDAATVKRDAVAEARAVRTAQRSSVSGANFTVFGLCLVILGMALDAVAEALAA